jgi:hypothetical protein
LVCEEVVALPEWLLKQWNDIKGNVKYGIVIAAGTAALTATGLLTHGLARWQQAILLFIFGLVLTWAVIVTALNFFRSKLRPDIVAGPPETSLRERVFAFCRELSAYMGEREIRPDEGKLYAQFKDSGTLFAQHYDAEIQSWDDKLSAGYWLTFRDRAINLRHELVLSNVRDRDIDNALSALERDPKSDYMKILQTLIEQLRYAASMLP